ncbi:MAG: hypothetical protein IJA02_11105 [Clostridia bacterium]|nr:hypothetical protein [Clostridia bacterium]
MSCTVSFFGHRYIEGDIWEIDEKLREIIRILINRNCYVDFLVGADGDFDRIVSSAIKHEQKLYGEYNAYHTLVLPYVRKEILDRNTNVTSFYNDVEICEKSCNAHPKKAFEIRNRDMVDRSDLVIFYVNHEHGGAYEMMKYAVQHGRRIFNIGSLQVFKNFDIYNSLLDYIDDKKNEIDIEWSYLKEDY